MHWKIFTWLNFSFACFSSPSFRSDSIWSLINCPSSSSFHSENKIISEIKFTLNFALYTMTHFSIVCLVLWFEVATHLTVEAYASSLIHSPTFLSVCASTAARLPFELSCVRSLMLRFSSLYLLSFEEVGRYHYAICFIGTKKNMLRQHWRESYLCMNGRRDAADKDAYDRIFLLVVQTSEIPSMSCGTRKESAACVSFHWFAQESVQIRFVRKSASQSLSHIQMRCCDGYRKFLVGEMAFSKSIHSSRNDVVFKLARSQYWNAITCTLAMRR